MLNFFGGLGVLLLVIGSASASPSNVQLGPIIVNSDSKILRLPQANAEQYCQNMGEHLPSAREFAQYIQANGAIGITEVADHNPSDQESYLISVVNPDGATDRFYFNYHGYDPIQVDSRVSTLWTSSTSTYDSSYPSVVLPQVGAIAFIDVIGPFAFQCTSKTN